VKAGALTFSKDGPSSEKINSGDEEPSVDVSASLQVN